MTGTSVNKVLDHQESMRHHHIQNGSDGHLWGEKLLCEAAHSSPSSPKVWKTCSFTSMLPTHLHGTVL